jgi:hypothetical protein
MGQDDEVKDFSSGEPGRFEGVQKHATPPSRNDGHSGCISHDTGLSFGGRAGKLLNMEQGVMRTVSGIALALLIVGGVDAKPVKTTGSFTLYYVAQVDPSKAGRGGIKGRVKTTEGKWETYRLSPADTRSANMEGTVSVTEPDGSTTVVSITRVGEWTDMPEGWHGRGNRMNPLTAYRTVAADQKYHPYGSRIFI